MYGLKTAVCAACGAAGAWIVRIFGGWDKDMTTLITLMAMDFAMGIIVAAVFKKSPKSANGAADSGSCFKGLCKKCIILLFVLLAHRLDLSLNTDYVKTAAVIGFIANEAISVIENAAIMGIPLPKTLTKAIDLLKEEKE